MENNLRLFEKSWIWYKLDNSGVRSSFTRSELCLIPENQSWKCCNNLITSKHVEENDICRNSFFPMLKCKAGLQANES